MFLENRFPPLIAAVIPNISMGAWLAALNETEHSTIRDGKTICRYFSHFPKYCYYKNTKCTYVLLMKVVPRQNQDKPIHDILFLGGW